MKNVIDSGSSLGGQQEGMYKKGFYITKPVGNNAFSFEQRKNKKLWVPSIVNASSLDQIELQNDLEKIAFEDFGFDDNLSTNYGLKHFYRFQIVDSMGKSKEIILFDNHNHALYFWYEAFHKGIIEKNATVIHIDEHADTRDNQKFITPEVAGDLQKMFEFTNFVTNVGDYILPAIHEGLVGEVVQIRNTQNLEDYLDREKQGLQEQENNIPLLTPESTTSPLTPLLRGEGKNKEGSVDGFLSSQEGQEKQRRNHKGKEEKGIILNLDLDFFQPDLDFIDYEFKKQVVLDAAKKADVITVCTSPFFIEQDLAIKVFKDIFGEYIPE